MLCTIKYPPYDVQVIFQVTEYDIVTDAIRKIQQKLQFHKIFFATIPSRNEKISHVIVSWIMHEGYSYDCVHYYSDVLVLTQEYGGIGGMMKLFKSVIFQNGVYIRGNW